MKTDILSWTIAANHYSYHMLNPLVGKKGYHLATTLGAVTFGMLQIQHGAAPSLALYTIALSPLAARLGANARVWEQEARRLTRKHVFAKPFAARWVSFDKHIELAGEALGAAACFYSAHNLFDIGMRYNIDAMQILAGLSLAVAIRHVVDSVDTLSRIGSRKDFIAPFHTPRNG